MGDVLSTAYQQAQLDMGIFSPETVSVSDLFVGALIPGLILVALYALYIIALTIFKPHTVPAIPSDEREQDFSALLKEVLFVLIPPIALIIAVLGSILIGAATPTEAASVGAMGSIILAISQRQFNIIMLKEVMLNTLRIIFLGASLFSLVFRGFGGDDLVRELLTDLPGGAFGAIFIVMLVMFLLGFILDFIEITFVVVPIVAPILLTMDINPIWLGIMIAINLQTSFLTPPFGFALFYLRGVAPDSIATSQIYKGVTPFIVIQLIGLSVLAYWPNLATWLPNLVYAK